MIKCILFDRDGTLGELTDKRYPQSIRPYANVKAVFQKLKSDGYIVGILTNQASIARGTGASYNFATEFKGYEADIWEICPHDSDDDCNCRKPKSGMLLSAVKRLNILPQECLLVGDRISDIQCAKNVGANACLVLTGYGKTELNELKRLYPDVPILPDFTHIFKLL